MSKIIEVVCEAPGVAEAFYLRVDDGATEDDIQEIARDIFFDWAN